VYFLITPLRGIDSAWEPLTGWIPLAAPLLTNAGREKTFRRFLCGRKGYGGFPAHPELGDVNIVKAVLDEAFWMDDDGIGPARI
jgi:hypothetical protein